MRQLCESHGWTSSTVVVALTLVFMLIGVPSGPVPDIVMGSVRSGRRAPQSSRAGVEDLLPVARAVAHLHASAHGICLRRASWHPA